MVRQKLMEMLEATSTRVQKNYDSVAKRFGGESIKVCSGEFFNLVSVMILFQALDFACFMGKGGVLNVSIWGGVLLARSSSVRPFASIVVLIFQC